MNWATAIVLIVAISAFAQVMTARYRARAGIIEDEDGNQTVADRSDPDAQREVYELRERIKVLERIATDANTAENRKIKDISDEIESLREK